MLVSSAIRKRVCQTLCSSFLSKSSSRNLNVKRVVYSSCGNPADVLRLEEIKLPDEPGDNEVLVEMFGSAINEGDIAQIRGSITSNAPTPKPNSPIVVGSEGAGTVLKVGKNVKTLKPNDTVVPFSLFKGTWSTHMMGGEKDFVSLDLDVERAIQLGPVLLAQRLLSSDFSDLKSGDTIIQNGANGAVGLSVTQIAFSRGIKTFNILRNGDDYADHAERIKSLGGYISCPYEYLSDYKFKRLISDLPRPKLALNGVGGPSVAEMAQVLETGGTLVTYGGISRKPVMLSMSSLLTKDVRARGFSLARWLESLNEAQRVEALRGAASIVKDGKVKTFGMAFEILDFNRAVDLFLQPSHRYARVLITSKILERLDPDV